MQKNKMSVRDVVQEVSNAHQGKQDNFDIKVSHHGDHYQINVNSLIDFEVDLLQSSLEDNGYTCYRFNQDGYQFLKVPKPE